MFLKSPVTTIAGKLPVTYRDLHHFEVFVLFIVPTAAG